MTYWLPVDDPRHTEVLGYHVSTKTGKEQWDQLDWRWWWIDGPEPHLFNVGGYYLHVRTKNKYRGKWDGTVYRVRCWYAGRKYRGREVENIGIGFKDGKLHWIVSTKERSNG